jgi:acetyltransferase-like isoleucine patch superfamily enzyme
MNYIKRGVIGDNSVIGSGCVISGKIPMYVIVSMNENLCFTQIKAQ